MHAQELFCLDPSSNYGFVNIDVINDSLIFLDPSRFHRNVQNFNGDLALEKIFDFCETVLHFYETGEKSQAKQLLQYSGENNLLHFGMSSGKSAGKGFSEDGLKKVFDTISQLSKLDDEERNDINVWSIVIPGFGEDHLSDLSISLVGQEIADYSESVYKKLGIATSARMEKVGNTWDVKSHCFVDARSYLPIVEGKPYRILLCPTQLAVKRYGYSTQSFINKIVLAHKQTEGFNNGSLVREKKLKNGSVKKTPFSKKDLQEKELKKYSGDTYKYKQYALDEIIKYPKYLDELPEGIGFENDNDINSFC